MRKAIPILVILVVLIVVAALLLPRYLNPERYRPQIEKALREATGWRVSLGDIKLQLFGGAAIQVKPVELSDPATGFRTEVAFLRVRAELKPLLKGNLVIRKIDVVKPAITLLWNQEGLQLPSRPRRTGGEAETPSQGRGGGPDITVSRVEIRGGSLEILHQVPDAPSVWTLDQVNGVILPAKGKLTLSGRAGQGGISLSVSRDGTTTVAMEGLGVEDLPPWLVQDLVQPGGVLSGTLDLAGGGREITGKLVARRLAFLDGQERLKKVDVGLSMARKRHGWDLRAFRMKAAGATLVASGSLAPKLDLALKLEPSPVEGALAVARSMHPIPIKVKGPGQVEATARLRRNPRGGVTAAASGSISAAVLRLMDGLPPIRQARAKFQYSDDGRLKISSVRGVLAGGALRGKVGLSPLSPPGALSLKASLEGADLQRLLMAFAVPRAREITGSATADATLRTDLSSGIPGPAGLRGKITTTVTDLRIPGWDLVSTVTAQLGKGGSWKDMLHALGSSKEKHAKSGKASFQRAHMKVVMDGLPWKVSALELDSPELEARGSGTFDPVRGTVRIQLKVRLNEALSRKLVENASFLSSLRDSSGRLVIPTTVRGPVTGPSISIDLESTVLGGKGYGGLLDSLLGGGK